MWFQRFWSFFGWLSIPLFAPDIEATLASAHGIVLDVGSGAGDWLYALSPRRNPNISKVILLEPNAHFHARLRLSAQENGLAGRYEIIGCRAKDPEHEGIQLQTIDTIVTVHVLCSVPSPQQVVGELYNFLKPVGRWLVYEHVRSNRAPAAAWQQIINSVWPFFLDGCSLTCETEKYLLSAGQWENVKLGNGSGEGYFNQLPHTVGSLTKSLSK
ncbi:hypothetical protein WHR41_09495 [Cladosporium halotolerans]|uniref:Methyltransferase domain-containing protein n=1 Tax=Cladosporium halotolerans TaxID=1052096 RepID=A0AB34KEY0_9PEZI